MKKTLITFCTVVLCAGSYAQQLKLEISNPQPRLGQSFFFKVSIDTLSMLFFKSLTGQFQLSDRESRFEGTPALIVNAQVSKTGKNIVGPFKLDFNGTTYTTNKLEFDVIDSLPNVDKGLWIRKVIENDSAFSIIVEQRIPVNPDIAEMYPSSLNRDSEVHLAGDIENVTDAGNWTSGFRNSFYESGQKKEYIGYFKLRRFIITDRKKHVVLKKGDFTDLPADFKFEDIVVN